MLGETLIELVLAPVLQLYVAAPFAFKVMEPPTQTTEGPLMLTTGSA